MPFQDPLDQLINAGIGQQPDPLDTLLQQDEEQEALDAQLTTQQSEADAELRRAEEMRSLHGNNVPIRMPGGPSPEELQREEFLAQQAAEARDAGVRPSLPQQFAGSATGAVLGQGAELERFGKEGLGLGAIVDSLVAMYHGIDPEEVTKARHEFEQQRDAAQFEDVAKITPEPLAPSETLTQFGGATSPYIASGIASSRLATGVQRALAERGVSQLPAIAGSQLAQEALLLPQTALTAEDPLDALAQMALGAAVGTGITKGLGAGGDFIDAKRSRLPKGPIEDHVEQFDIRGLTDEFDLKGLTEEFDFAGGNRARVPTTPETRFDIPKAEQLPLFPPEAVRGAVSSPTPAGGPIAPRDDVLDFQRAQQALTQGDEVADAAVREADEVIDAQGRATIDNLSADSVRATMPEAEPPPAVIRGAEEPRITIEGEGPNVSTKVSDGGNGTKVFHIGNTAEDFLVATHDPASGQMYVNGIGAARGNADHLLRQLGRTMRENNINPREVTWGYNNKVHPRAAERWAGPSIDAGFEEQARAMAQPREGAGALTDRLAEGFEGPRITFDAPAQTRVSTEDEWFKRTSSVGVSPAQAAHMLDDPAMSARVLSAMRSTGKGNAADALEESMAKLNQIRQFQSAQGESWGEALAREAKRLKSRVQDEGGYIVVGNWTSRLENAEQMYKSLVSDMKQKPQRTAAVAFYNLMLSSPRTWARNFVGNAAELATQQGERMLMHPRATIAGLGQGDGFIQGITNLYEITKQASSDGWLSAKLGVPIDELFEKNAGRLAEELQFAAGHKAAVPSRVLLYWDQFFQGLSFYSGAYQKAYAQAQQQGLEPGSAGFKRSVESWLKNMGDDTLEELRLDAKRVTFRDFGKGSDIAVSARRFMNENVPVSKEMKDKFGLGAGDILMPFIRTPFTIARRTIEYNPVNGVYGAYLAMRSRLADEGSEEAAKLGAEGLMRMRRSFVGMIPLAAAYSYAENGVVTGDFTNLTSRQKSAYRRAGIPPMSIKVDDSWVGYNNLGPITAILGLAANMNEFNKSGSREGQSDTDYYASFAARYGQETVKAALDASFIPNLLDMINGIMRGQQYDVALGAQLGRMAQPASILNDVARYNDVQRQGNPENVLDAIGDAFQQRTPGLRGNVPPKLDDLGQEQPRVGGFFEQSLSPVNREEVDTSAGAQLYNNVKDFPNAFDMGPEGPVEDPGISGLERRQRDELISVARGRMLELAYNEARGLPPEEQQIVIDRMVNRAGDLGGNLANAVRLGEVSMEEAMRILREME